MKTLTVAVPCYNSQDYMRHAIEPLLICENDIEIKVTVLNALAIKQHSKNPSIQLTLNKTKQHLQPIVSDSGKRYANIQWNWWEKAQSAVLSNSVGEVIVDGCIKH